MLGEYSRKFNGLTRKEGIKVTSGQTGWNSRRAWQMSHSSEEDAIRGVPGQSQEDMSAVHIYIVAARSLL